MSRHAVNANGEAEALSPPEDLAGLGQSDGGKQVWHTLTACQRCRKRKTKCDPKLPRCTSCEKSDAPCIYWDAAKGVYMPRSYVVQLQGRIRRLEAELANLRTEPNTVLSVEDLVRSAGLVRIRENAESRFLGPSSGINMTRLVMELAKSLSHTKSIKEIVPETMAREAKQRFETEAAKPLSKIYPSTSSVAAPDLPSFDLTHRLVEGYLATAQIFYPVLHEPSFRQDMRDVYNGSTDPYQNFALRMVISLSMHKTDTQWTGLADSFYLAALKYLEGTIRPRNLGTLQCFTLIALYSLATPTRTATYWVVGLASKLLHELRMTDESSIGCDVDGYPLDPLQVDLRRRLYYVCVNMELGLAHSLGRPSAFSVTHDHNDVKLYSEVDDIYITDTGIAPDAVPILKKQMSIHFMQMRWLQLEIRRTLYLKKRPTPVDDHDPWFQQMESKLEHWMLTYPKPADGNGFPAEWFRVRYNTMVVFLFRPSPQVAQPSLHAVKRAFRASVENIHLQRAQIEANSADVTWVFAQQLFMAINTVLWALSYSDLRQDHSRSEVTRDLKTALDAIFWASRKWPGVESALTLYSTLVDSCLKAYDGDAAASYGAASPANRANPASPPPSSVESPPALGTSPSTVNTNRHVASRSISRDSSARPQSLDPDFPPFAHQAMSVAGPLPSASAHLHTGTPGSQLNVPSPQFSQTSQTSIDTNAFFHPLPSPLPYAVDQTVQQPNLFAHMLPDNGFMMGNVTTEEQLMPYLTMFEPQTQMEGITLTEQEELMRNLELYDFGMRQDPHPPK